MKFPLPQGYCRSVCRPIRAGRYSQLDVVVRMAMAAVRRGWEPCEIARAVRSAVGCSENQCEQELYRVEVQLDSLLEAAEKMIKELDILATIFRMNAAARGQRPTESGWEVIWENILAVFKIWDIIIGVYDLLEACWNFLDQFAMFVDELRNLKDCLSSVQS